MLNIPRLLYKSQYRDYTRLGKQNYRKECLDVYLKEVSQRYYRFYRETDKSHRQRSIGKPQGRLANQKLGKGNQLKQLLVYQIQNRVDRLPLEQIKYIQRRIPYYLRLLICVVIFIFRFLDLTPLSIEDRIVYYILY